MRSRDVFAHSEARYTAVGRIARPESYKDGAVPYKTVERHAIQCYAVLCGLRGCYMETGSNCMVQGCAIWQYAVEYYVALSRCAAGFSPLFTFPSWCFFLYRRPALTLYLPE